MKIRKHSKFLILISLFSIASLSLTACQVGNPETGGGVTETVELQPLAELTPVTDPLSITGPSHVQVGGPTLAAVADHPAYVLPATVTSKDLDGTRPEIEITDNSRIIALSVTGSLADLVVALGFGDNLVGKDIATTAPGTANLPLVTTVSHTINQEGVIALQPTVVFTDGSIGPDDVVRYQLREAGIPVVAIERIVDFETTYAAARDVATALGAPAVGDALALEIEQAIDAKISEIERFIPTDEAKIPSVVFLYLRGASGVYFMFGEGSGVDTLLEAVGVRDIATELGWRGERPLTPEALPALNPDIILVMTKGLDSVGGVDSLISDLPGVAQTNAGKNRRILDIDDTLLFAGATRTPDVLDGLARAFYTAPTLSASS